MSSDIARILSLAATMADDSHLDPADEAVLDEALRRYPFFTAAAVALLRHGNGDEARRHQLAQQVALTASCRRTQAFAAQGSAWAEFYPPVEQAPAQRTEDVIDTFLSTYGTCSPEEERQLERLIFNPTPDYAEMLARQEQQELPDSSDDEADPGMARINAFIRRRHPAANQHSHAEEHAEPESTAEDNPISRPEHADQSLLSESLAKIFIRQGRYERAYEIISGLNLNFPKKSAYFADQLRFLQKLIINQRRRQELEGSGDTEK